MFEEKMSRRSFIALSAVTATSLALDCSKINALAANMGNKANYPVVVIGAGLGGLSAAALLSKFGVPVTVVEQHMIPGGYATAFERGDFTFEVSLHQTSINNSATAAMLKELGLLDKLKFIPLPGHQNPVELAETLVKIVDPLTRKELGPNEMGELAVRGALVTKGYYKAPEETAKVYQQGWFFSGDMSYQDRDGFIYLVGRSREMINRGGENVYPVEVENVLHLHPKILDIAVFGLPDPVMGSMVACAVVPRPGSEKITLKEIQEFCRDQLASYKIPQKVFFLREMPTNPGGKVMKNKLIEHFSGK